MVALIALADASRLAWSANAAQERPDESDKTKSCQASYFAAAAPLICALKPHFAAASAPTNSVTKSGNFPREKITCETYIEPTYCGTRTTLENHNRTPPHKCVCGRNAPAFGGGSACGSKFLRGPCKQNMEGLLLAHNNLIG